MDNLQLMRKHLDAYNAGNWTEYEGHLAGDVRYEEIPTKVSASGSKNYVDAVKRWKSAFPDLRATVRNAIAAGDTVVSEIEWIGTQSGPLDGPFGTIAPTNKKGSTPAVIVTRFANGRIAEVHHYFDTMTILAQLGVLSGATAPGGQPKARESRASAG